MRLRNEEVLSKRTLGICPLSAFLFEGEIRSDVWLKSQIISPILFSIFDYTSYFYTFDIRAYFYLIR